MRRSKESFVFLLVPAILAVISQWTHAFTTSNKKSKFAFPISSISTEFQRPSISRLNVASEEAIAGDATNREHSFRKQEDHNELFHDGILTPYHLLHPNSFDESRVPYSKKLPLFSILQLMRKALKFSIIKNHDECLESSNASRGPGAILRIQHELSHTVDPLCWLQAQRQLIAQRKDPSIFFSTAEGTFESASYGASISHLGTANDDEYWKIVERLPGSTNIYGGQRFDSESPIAEEWEGFSKGFWILPAVELRRELSFSEDDDKKEKKTTLAIHLVADENGSFLKSCRQILDILLYLTDASTAMAPPTTLPPVLSRISTYGLNLDGQELYEKGVTAALNKFDDSSSDLEKVVLARRMDLSFARHAAENVQALDVLRKWKFGSQPGGHIFFLDPGKNDCGEFFGCTPERLFQMTNRSILSEALAGTRPRGSTRESDTALSQQLFESSKDQAENQITGNFIRSTFQQLQQEGSVAVDKNENSTHDSMGGEFFVRRLRHLQHICQRFACTLAKDASSANVTRQLLSELHPTPAMGGFPKQSAMNFIREYETSGFDRGFYSGPVGYVGRDAAEIMVAIRSGLLQTKGERPKLSVFAGAGIVPGSTVQGEWAETSYKLAVVSSIFPQSPITLQSAENPNIAWATAFIEELIRSGVTQFYICPGSRSTPLVTAIARATRAHAGVVHALSIHDERGAAFRAIGYGRGCGKPAAVITSSGTAVANLYPAIVEAGMDGVPMIVLTADRPYESRNTGANQAIDQTKIFSDTYLRWFRDILPPSDEVPVSSALSDATHGVMLATSLRGPVHFNIQFRENLAPDGGSIRNDDRLRAVTRYDAIKFTESAAFQKWSLGGGQWLKSYIVENSLRSTAVSDIGSLILKSKRAMIIVGNLRMSTTRIDTEDIVETTDLISTLAMSTGIPIFASALSGTLRFKSSCVVPFAEHILRCPIVHENLKPDLIIQFGAPLISTEVPKVIKTAVRENIANYVIVHPHHSSERADPDLITSHRVDLDPGVFARSLITFVEEASQRELGSELAPLVHLGRSLQKEMPALVKQASDTIYTSNEVELKLSEPEIVLALSEGLSRADSPDISLFISNSMPIRDAEAFFYPIIDSQHEGIDHGVQNVGVNRGASGIDGIIASASGFADATKRPTVLLIGDVAALHDLNSLHALQTCGLSRDADSYEDHPLTTIVMNNDGGGIFSFLPISSHGADVSFDEFFGTPTNTFSFEKGADAFDLDYQRVRSIDSFQNAYRVGLSSGKASIIEAYVAPRDDNVKIHKEISKETNIFIENLLQERINERGSSYFLPMKEYSDSSRSSLNKPKVIILLHGWMGDKSEWDEVGQRIVEELGENWRVLSFDLPGHGESKLLHSSPQQMLRSCLQMDDDMDSIEVSSLSIDSMAMAVEESIKQIGIDKIDAIAGYSLGGRVALAMQRSSLISLDTDSIANSVVTDQTKLTLLSTYPGDFVFSDDYLQERAARLEKDDRLAATLSKISYRTAMLKTPGASTLEFSNFLNTWYTADIWGFLRGTPKYRNLLKKRSDSLAYRARDFAAVLQQSSPSRHRFDDWRGVIPKNTQYIFGSLDTKFKHIGETWGTIAEELRVESIEEKGHALLLEEPLQTATKICDFLQSRSTPLAAPKTRLTRATASNMQSVSQPLDMVSSIEPDEENAQSSKTVTTFASLDFERFIIDFSDDYGGQSGISGIGWGEKAKAKDTTNQRSGIILQVMSIDGLHVGVGEVSPLAGVHKESFIEAEKQLNAIAAKISSLESERFLSFDAEGVLAMNGDASAFIDQLSIKLDIAPLLRSVRSGLEMALFSLASQAVHTPMHQALIERSTKKPFSAGFVGSISLNGLITRGSATTQIALDQLSGRQRKRSINFESWKVKVGHQSTFEDAMAISYAYEVANSSSKSNGKVRADANRAFDQGSAENFASVLKGINDEAYQMLEYVEEPLQRDHNTLFIDQIELLEAWSKKVGISYALDESISDLAEQYSYDYDRMAFELTKLLRNSSGCAALVLKPSLLGLELSLRLAKLARAELGIGAVFTSSFDSGVGLAYASFLAYLSDMSPAKEGVVSYPHGLGTFTSLASDSISPSFGSYVNEDGKLNIASLSRSFYGLRLDEVQGLTIDPLPSPELTKSSLNKMDFQSAVVQTASMKSSEEFEASTATSSDGREIQVVASLPLPFSADVACSKFTDLPQQPRWSPWISSVSYVDAKSETEWHLRVRGVNFRWRAKSSLLSDPYRGIRWQSVSGLKNTGAVEFIPSDDFTCLMKVQITFVTPRILAPLFNGTLVFFEDFLRNKVLKWSLEMFRDVVKGDLALEEGDVELGDALFGSVEGKASAIEATLSSPIDSNTS